MTRPIADVADDPDLPPDWLHDPVKGFLPGEDVGATTPFRGRALTVRVASPRYLPAMKLAAARYATDVTDIRILVSRLAITSAREALEVVGSYYPPSRLLPKTRYLVDELLGPTDGDEEVR